MSNPQVKHPTPYVGRFAPSPTGPLHFGSLLSAIASYLDARANKGTWLVRMEDLDPPREPPGAAAEILAQLQQFDLEWDGAVLYQSSRLTAYAEALQQLLDAGLCYACACTRPQVRAMGNVYNGHCREARLATTARTAMRVKTQPLEIVVNDAVQGQYKTALATECGDFIIRRKDGLFAYQLAVVVDDAYQGVTHIIRGYDLLDSTPRQIYLQQLLHLNPPQYGHIPVIVDARGEKLSKQTFAPAIDATQAVTLTHSVLQLLGQSPPPISSFSNNRAQLQWAIEHWDIQAVPKLANIRQANSR